MLGIQPVALAMTCFSLKKWTPLHIAAREGHMNTVELLINNGADINIQDNDEVSRVSDLYSCVNLELNRSLRYWECPSCLQS